MITTIKEAVCDMIIRAYGFEAKETVKFCHMAEDPAVSYTELRREYVRLMNNYKGNN